MRHTPFLDGIGIEFKNPMTEEQTDHLVNVVDSALSVISNHIDWGEYEGRKRKPCPEQPLLMTGMPIGQYHCPFCGEMQLAAIPHLAPDEHYEEMTGHDWPPGYYEEEAIDGSDRGHQRV